MTAAKNSSRPYAPPRGEPSGRARKTIFELPPLELECMKVVWEQGEASVRQIREQLAADHRPLAYTTVETIMDRLSRKGAVSRRKVGKAHIYTAVYLKSAARAQAVAAVVKHFFGGSRAALRGHLDGAPDSGAPVTETRRSRSLGTPASPATSPRPSRSLGSRPAPKPRGQARLDTSLL